MKLLFGIHVSTSLVVCIFIARYHCTRLKRSEKCPEKECIDLFSCDAAIDNIINGIEPTICYWDNDVIKVCCPSLGHESKELQRVTRGISECGSRESRNKGNNPVFLAVGGQPAKYRWPWMVAIYYKSTRKLLCGGSLIDDRHILTAAHCFNKRKLDPKLFLVQIGILERGQHVQTHRIEKIKIHEDYKPNLYYHDVAILRLAKRVPPNLVPVCLPILDNLKKGEKVLLLGWGDLYYKGPDTKKLQKVELPIVTNKECDNSYKRVSQSRLPHGVWDKFVCAGLKEGGKDACQGDSGGPLLKQTRKGAWVQIGIVAFGHKCAEPGYPGVYTKVASYLPWIYRNMGDYS